MTSRKTGIIKRLGRLLDLPKRMSVFRNISQKIKRILKPNINTTRKKPREINVKYKSKSPLKLNILENSVEAANNAPKESSSTRKKSNQQIRENRTASQSFTRNLRKLNHNKLKFITKFIEQIESKLTDTNPHEINKEIDEFLDILYDMDIDCYELCKTFNISSIDCIEQCKKNETNFDHKLGELMNYKIRLEKELFPSRFSSPKSPKSLKIYIDSVVPYDTDTIDQTKQKFKLLLNLLLNRNFTENEITKLGGILEQLRIKIDAANPPRFRG